MKNLFTKSALTLLVAGMAVSTQAATPEFMKAMQEIGEDAIQGYFEPFATGIGVGMNSQWAYSSKTASFLGLPVGVSLYIGYPLIMVDDKMKTFTFEGSIPTGAVLSEFADRAGISLDSMALVATGGDQDEANKLLQDLSKDSLDIPATEVPTVYGSDKQKKLAFQDIIKGSLVDSLIKSYNSAANQANALVPDSLQLDTIRTSDSIPLPFRGLNISFAPSLPPVGANFGFSSIPVLDNLTLGVRFIPMISHEDLGSVGMLGLSVQHEITNHIPILGSLPFLHFGLLYGYNRLTVEVKDVVSIESRNNIYMFTGSVDLKFLVGVGVYGGIGMEQSTIAVDVFPQEVGDVVTTPEFSAEIEGANKLRAQVGARASFAAFDVYGDVNFGNVKTFNVGVAIGLNGL